MSTPGLHAQLKDSSSQVSAIDSHQGPAPARWACLGRAFCTDGWDARVQFSVSERLEQVEVANRHAPLRDK